MPPRSPGLNAIEFFVYGRDEQTARKCYVIGIKVYLLNKPSEQQELQIKQLNCINRGYNSIISTFQSMSYNLQYQNDKVIIEFQQRVCN